MDHPEFPTDKTGAIIRVQSLSGHYLYEAIDNGKRTILRYITEFNFGGNVPKGIVQSAANDKFMANVVKLKKLLVQENPELQTL